MRLLLPILLLACAPDPTSPNTEATEQSAPPAALAFEVGPLWIGREVTFTVAGPPAGSAVRVYASFTPGAARTCPPELGGACLGIGRARLIAEGVAPRTGPTVLRVVLPATTPEDAVAVQAAVTRAGQTGLSAVVRTRMINAARTDSDGDGLMDGPELDHGTNPLDADTDADLLQDGDEVRYGADPTNADTDGDGVFDGAEVRLHATDPRLADTDGDGVSDGFELAIGLNPLIPDPGGPGPNPFRDGDGDGIPDYLDAETCDGRDNDGDGAIDEGFDADDSDHDGVRDCLEIEDCDCVDDDGDGQIAEHCQFALHGVLAADDRFQAWLDDQPLATGAGFNTPTSFVAPVMGGVRHVNVEAWDVGSNYVGFLGRVGFNGTYTNTTGVPGPWTTRSTAPPAGWLTNPTGFFTPFEVRDCGWNGGPTALRSAGADWIWPEVIPAGATAGCATVPGYDPYGVPVRAWFTTELLVCGENLEVCDGLDNNANGQVDEGLADSDGDGLCDAREYEVCNGIDDDGDGEVDEGLPDADGDGVCNAVDMETCDGFDNDGDWLIDESPDADYDGVSDCGVDACAIPDTSLFLFSSGNVARLDLTTAALTPLAVGQTPNAASDAVFAPGGQVLAAVGAREVWRMSSAGVPSQLLHTMPMPANPNLVGNAAITVDETGRVYTADRDRVAWWDPATNQDGTFGLLPGAQFNGIAWHDGHLYLASDLGSGTRIDEANPSSGLLTLVTTVAVDDIQFLAIAHNGTAWTIDGARRVVSFPITGGPVSILTTLQSTWNGGALRGGWCEAGVEVCNGVDDDGDGQVDDDLDDEDADADGICDGLDVEICDGVDNDGDAQVDEGTADADGDGLCDLIDAEQCDGVDNDGDGVIDDGMLDNDTDGVCNALDVEACDGLDNDGDGSIDEGFDLDADGVPDCNEDPCEVDDPRIFLSTTPYEIGFNIPVDSRVEAMNIDTGAVTTVAQGSVYLADIAFHPDGRLFGIDGGATVFGVPYNGHPGFAAQITDPAQLGPPGIAGPALTVDAAGHLLLSNGANLWTIDADTLQVIAHVGNAQGIYASGDLAFVEGELYLSGYVPLIGSGLYRVDRTTGALTLVVPLTTAMVGVDTMLDGSLVGGVQSTVRRVDLLTGLSTPVGTLPNSRNVWGAATPVSWCNARQELCNGVDDDDDGLVDEGAPDSDGDGLCDSYDAEACDLVDNDGDGAVDEGFDSDGDGLPDCADLETCDGLDNDGDGAVDEGFDSNLDGIADCFGPDLCNCVDDDHDGQLDEDCSYNLSMIATGVGTWSVWLDGAPWMSGDYTSGPSSVSATVSGGVHPIAAKIDVDSLSLPGWLADVYVDGVSVAPTASGRWTVSTQAPPPGWQTTSLGAMERLAFGASYPAQPGFAASTAQWVWSDWPDPARFSGNWYTLDLLVCGPPGPGTREVCDGLDNDNDGVVDNGFGDADSNGVADCFEAESVCDGVDNDGDGFTDEGFADSDLDGVPDCAEALEPCDGRDNNGDGVVDEGCCDPNDTQVYAAVDDGVDMVLTVLDPGGLTETPVGPMLDTVTDLSFTPSGDLYGIGANGELYRIDPTSGATMPLGQVLSGGQTIATLGLASDVSGNLWALSPDAVWSLDVASLTATPIITFSAGALLDAGDLTGLGGRLYVTGLEAATGDWAVVEVDINTGVVTSRVTMGPEAAGLTGMPGGLLFTGLGDLLVETDPVTALRTALLQASGDIRGLAARGVVCGGLRPPVGRPQVRQ
jgi:hypothetical protein